jgi:DNA-binding NarL/FixJ family response regulator
MSDIKVGIVEDNKIINESLANLICTSEGYDCAGKFLTAEDCLKEIKDLDVDVLLMDIRLPGMNGIECVSKIKAMGKDVSILMLTVHEENDLIFEALCAGAVGYLIKKTHPARILDAIQEAYEGGAPMSAHIARKVTSFFMSNKKITPDDSLITEREQEILKELIKGKTYYAIALTLGVSKDTVRFHIKNIYKKLHVHSQAEAVAEAIKKGIV